MDYGDRKQFTESMQTARQAESANPSPLARAAAQTVGQQRQAVAAIGAQPGAAAMPPPEDVLGGLFDPTGRPMEDPMAGVFPAMSAGPAAPSAYDEIAALWEVAPNEHLAQLLDWMERQGVQPTPFDTPPGDGLPAAPPLSGMA